jgi:hypothetical protein
MGIRIHFHAVDLPQFEVFLNRSLASTLWYVAQQDTRDSSELPHLRLNTPDYLAHYLSSPRFGVRLIKKGQERVDLTHNEVFADPFLATSLKDYLRKNSSYDLHFLLNALEVCPGANIVRTVSEGYRRGWIGSFLDCIDQNRYATPEEYSKLIAMFHKVLRNADCGKTIPANPYQLSDLEFPVVPNEDIDLYMGVWTPSEVSLFTSFTRTLLKEHTPVFSTPPLDREDDVQHGASFLELDRQDYEYNVAVHTILADLLQIDTLGFEQTAVVSFMG